MSKGIKLTRIIPFGLGTHILFFDTHTHTHDTIFTNPLIEIRSRIKKIAAEATRDSAKVTIATFDPTIFIEFAVWTDAGWPASDKLAFTRARACL